MSDGQTMPAKKAVKALLIERGVACEVCNGFDAAKQAFIGFYRVDVL